MTRTEELPKLTFHVNNETHTSIDYWWENDNFHVNTLMGKYLVFTKARIESLSHACEEAEVLTCDWEYKTEEQEGSFA